MSIPMKAQLRATAAPIGALQHTKPPAVDRMEIEAAVAEIEDNLDRLREEGFETPRYWYALDRLAVIRDICDKLLAKAGEKDNRA